MCFDKNSKVVCIEGSSKPADEHNVIENNVYVVYKTIQCPHCKRYAVSVGQKLSFSDSIVPIICTCGENFSNKTDFSTSYWRSERFAPIEDWAIAISEVNSLVKEVDKVKPFSI